MMTPQKLECVHDLRGVRLSDRRSQRVHNKTVVCDVFSRVTVMDILSYDGITSLPNRLLALLRGFLV